MPFSLTLANGLFQKLTQTVFRDKALQMLIVHLVDIIVLSSSLKSVSFSVQKLTSWDTWYLLMVLKLILTRQRWRKTGPSQELLRNWDLSRVLSRTTADLSHILLHKQNRCISWSQSCMKVAKMVGRETNLLRAIGTKTVRKHLTVSSKCWPSVSLPNLRQAFQCWSGSLQRSQEQDGQVICFWSDQYPMPAEPEEELRGTWTTTLPERWKSYLSSGPSLHKSSKSTCYTLPSQGWQTTTPWLTRSQRPSLELLSSDGCLNWLQAWRVWDWPSWSSLGIFYQYPCYTWVSARAYNSSQGAIIGDWDRESREPCTPVIWDIFSLFF